MAKFKVLWLKFTLLYKFLPRSCQFNFWKVNVHFCVGTIFKKLLRVTNYANLSFEMTSWLSPVIA